MQTNKITSKKCVISLWNKSCNVTGADFIAHEGKQVISGEGVTRKSQE